MIEYDRAKQNNPAEKAELKICVAGVGGAGSNVLDRITLDRSVDANLVCFHTDVRVLNHGMASNKVQLGGDLMKGVGAGGDPDLGREAALYSKEQIRQTLQGHEIVFICTGLGGGTGSGAAPVVAEIAKSSGALVVVLATMPFSFEGRRRLNQAEEALELLQKRADALILFDNNRMGELVLPKEGIQKAFTLADQTLAQCARAVAIMVSTPGLVKLGLDDLVSALNASNGRCLFGFGDAKGPNRGADALKKAIKSPLIDSGRLLQETKNLLVHIVGGESLTLSEVDGIMKQLGRSVPEQTQILFGLAVDPKLGDSISVTLISSLGLEQLAAKHVMAEEIPAPQKPVIVERKLAATPPPLPVARAQQPAAPPPPPSAPAAAEPPLELFAAARPAPEPEPPGMEMFEEESVDDHGHVEVEPEARAEEAVSDEPEPVAEIEETPTATVSVQAKQIEPAVTTVRSRKTERQPTVVSRGVLAAVLSSQSAVASHVAAAGQDEDAQESVFSSAEDTHEPVLAGAAARGEQQTFRLGDEDRGRFKDTEPSISDGEDLDVPTWMRLRKKTRH
jgi:cell division protein FtsZ